MAGLEEGWLQRRRADVAGRTVAFVGYGDCDPGFPPVCDSGINPFLAPVALLPRRGKVDQLSEGATGAPFQALVHWLRVGQMATGLLAWLWLARLAGRDAGPWGGDDSE